MEKNKVVGFLPKLLYRIFLTLKDKFDPKPLITSEEEYACEISFKLITHPSSKLSYSPISSKRIIKNESLRMYILIENYTIHIINHTYSYTVYLQSTENFQKLKHLFDENLEKTRNELENEIRQNIQYSLKTILSRLD